jgi:hypothetical protein
MGWGAGLMSEVVPGTEFALEGAVGLAPVHRRRKPPAGGPDVPGIVFDRYHATRYVKKEAAGSLNLDLVREG